MGDFVISFLPCNHWQGSPLSTDISMERYLTERWKKASCSITPSGREAVSLLMQHLQLKSDDEVYITTTFEYPNVSSCVTSTIFNFCKPARTFTERTRAIFAIHEFGVPHGRLQTLRKLADSHRIPLIEDCAHTLDSYQDGVVVGSIADFTICSFPKIFPVPYGGALIGSPVSSKPSPIDCKRIDRVRAEVTPHLPLLETYSESRRTVYRQLTGRLKELGMRPLFEVSDSVAPWLFPVQLPVWQECVERSAEFGVDCALWHGSEIVILPCHQFLSVPDLDRIIAFIDLMRKA